MKFEVIQMLPIYDSENKVIKTNVTFKPNEKSIMVIDIDKDLTKESKDIIIDAVLEQIYNDWFPNKAENEKFVELNTTLSKANETITITRQAYSETITSVAVLEDKLYRLAEHIQFNLDEEDEEDVVTD